MRVVRWLCGVVCLSALLSGCASPGSVKTGDDRPAYAVALDYGPIDETARRPAGLNVESLFEPMNYATPNERRLGSGAPGPAYWQQRVDYDIDCRVDTEAESVSGTMRMTYHNNSPHRLDYLWIQLEQNLFNPESLGARAHTPGGVLRGRPTFEGGYTIPRISGDGRELEFHIYDTLARVELPTPIRPGDVTMYELEWSFDIPPYLRRMGAETVEQGKIFELAQWFPHACNYDDVHGWNTLPYLGTGEFYTNYGTYEVAVTVPSSYVVTATGVLQNEREVLTGTVIDRLAEAMASDEPVWIVSPDEVGDPSMRPTAEGELTWRFRADEVRTFAFAASDAFVWDACKADVKHPDMAQGEITSAVLCQSLYPKEATAWSPDHEDGGSTRIVKHSIEFYSDWLHPYPYPHMTSVNGPEGGMEYPMIVFCGGRTSPGGMKGVTDHEVGHSWFPMLVNTDERRHIWMDEGFNTFINIYARADLRNDEINFDRHKRQSLEVARANNSQPVVLPPDYMWRRWRGQ
ncbi:MAG: M1 family metallopeptidase, partial [Phycisphaerales bacterium]|nr:M1 family metallopeptidase [Phycisphaerales bacterium]